MRNNNLFVVLTAIVILIFLGSFAYIRSSSRNKLPAIHTITANNSPTPSLTQCQPYQLAATIFTQGAAGNIYGTLELVNTSKTNCYIELGNTITASFTANNIILHNQKTVPSENFLLTPLAVAYSQFHFPNGAQCTNGVSPKKIAFSYKSGQTVIQFPTTQHTEKLMIQACSSQKEKTIVDIWPLSKNRITP